MPQNGQFQSSLRQSIADHSTLRNCCCPCLHRPADFALAVLALGICSGIAVSWCHHFQRVVERHRPYLLAIILSALAFNYSFLPPLDSFVAKPDQIPRFLVFIVSATFVASLSVAQRRATESLRHTRDDLNETVRELKKTNEALSKSETYLAEAQVLSHTGSAGWNVSTEELIWSEDL